MPRHPGAGDILTPAPQESFAHPAVPPHAGWSIGELSSPLRYRAPSDCGQHRRRPARKLACSSPRKAAAVSATIIFDQQVTFVTDPVNPCAGGDFTVFWQEKNVGEDTSTDYQDIFDLDDQGSGDSQSLSCDPLVPGQSAMRSLTFNLPAGDYRMSLVINGSGPIDLGNVIVGECSTDVQQ
jgi:hypothetical protein